MSQPPPAPPRPPHAGNGPPRRRLVREPEGRKISGVCAGLADHLGIDVTVVRTGAVVLALITPLALIAYVVASVVTPERAPGEPRVRARRVHPEWVPHPILVVAAIVATAALVDGAWWLDPFPAAIALIGAGVWLIVRDRDEPADAYDSGTPSPPAAPFDTGPSGAAPTPPVTPSADAPTLVHPMAASPWIVTVSQHSAAEGGTDTTFTGRRSTATPVDQLGLHEDAGPSGESTPPASPWWSGGAAGPPAAPTGPEPSLPIRSRLGPVVVAVLLTGAGLVWLADSLGIITVSWTDALALGLVVVGLALVLASWLGRARGLIAVGCVLAGLLVAGDAIDVPLDAGTGDRTVVADSRAELTAGHELFAGELTLDLSDAPLSRQEATRVEAAVAFGGLKVIVPREATVDVEADVQMGEVIAPGGAEGNEDGIGLDVSFTLDGEPGAPRLVLDLYVALGSIEISRG